MQLGGAGTVELGTVHETLDVLDRAGTNARVLELPHEPANERGLSRRHGHDDFRDAVAIAHLERVANAPEHASAIQNRFALGEIVIEIARQLDGFGASLGELAADGQPAPARPNDEDAARCPQGRTLVTGMPAYLGVRHLPATQSPQAERVEERQQDERQDYSSRERHPAEPATDEEGDPHGGGRDGDGARLAQARVTPDHPMTPASDVRETEQQPDGDGETSDLG